MEWRGPGRGGGCSGAQSVVDLAVAAWSAGLWLRVSCGSDVFAWLVKQTYTYTKEAEVSSEPREAKCMCVLLLLMVLCLRFHLWVAREGQRYECLRQLNLMNVSVWVSC